MKSQIVSGIPVSQSSEKPRLSLRPQLTQLAAKGSIQQLEALLEDGVEVDTPSPNGSTALVVAAKYGQLQAVNILLKYGAKTHQEAILAAKESGHVEIVDCLQTVLGIGDAQHVAS